MIILKYLKRLILWILILIIGFFLGYVVATYIGGYMPERYQSNKSKSFDFSKKKLWNVLTNFEKYPNWKSGVIKVELLGRNNNNLFEWREYRKKQKPVTYEISNIQDQDLLEIRVSKTKAPIQDTWIFKLTEHKGKGILQIKQFVVIKSPYPRFKAKFIDGHMANIDSFMFAMNRRLKWLKKIEEEELKKKKAAEKGEEIEEEKEPEEENVVW